MRKSSLLKIGYAALIAASTMLAPKVTQAAGLCVYQYTLPNGQVCTFVRDFDGCCRYQTTSGAATVCPPVCGVGQ
jgi:hypothetical protein